MQTNQTSLTDQDRMEDLLAQEKSLISGYGTFIPEASCPQLRQVLMDNFNGCAQNQFAIFDEMSNLGWYPTPPAPQPQVDAARQKFSQIKQQIQMG